MQSLHKITFALVIVGALNWLLIGLFRWEIGLLIPWYLQKILYIVIGLAAIYEIAIHKKLCKECSKPKMATPAAGNPTTPSVPGM